MPIYMSNWTKKNPLLPQPYTKYYRQLRKTESKRSGPSGKKTLICYLVPNNQPHKPTYNHFICIEHVIFRNTYAYTYTLIHTITISERKCHSFEAEQARFYRSLLEGKKKGRNCVIIIPNIDTNKVINSHTSDVRDLI